MVDDTLVFVDTFTRIMKRAETTSQEDAGN